MLADYHIHLENGPLTMAYLEEFLQVAGQRGLEEVGFAEHGYNFSDSHHLWPPGWHDYKPTQGLEDYVELVLAARARGYPVKLGLEMDYVEGREEDIASFLAPYPWDYVIGSIHHVGDWGFDHPNYQSQWERVDILATYEEYFRLFSKAAQSGLFDVMAHPDVIKIFAHRPTGDISHLWEVAAKSMAAGNVAVELNTGGLRKPVKELYPAPGFLEVCSLGQIPLVISSDAHHPKEVGQDFDQAVALATTAGYNSVCRFSNRKRKYLNLPSPT